MVTISAAAEGTVAVAVPFCPLNDAWITEAPPPAAETPVITPVLAPTVTCAGVAELHVAKLVQSEVPPSDQAHVAKSC